MTIQSTNENEKEQLNAIRNTVPVITSLIAISVFLQSQYGKMRSYLKNSSAHTATQNRIQYTGLYYAN
ncbi:MAG: hypothetical protein KatS3mg088_655 [Patescibacteria group bacterium]|nr:MAG: hypothetical protein KatS3mg088_655 [Patescibacteria group bacterium]